MIRERRRERLHKAGRRKRKSRDGRVEREDKAAEDVMAGQEQVKVKTEGE
jgi:hypothetical protein